MENEQLLRELRDLPGSNARNSISRLGINPRGNARKAPGMR